MKRTHTVSFKYDHGQVLHHTSSPEIPLTVIQQQMRVMTDGTATKWYMCRLGGGNIIEAYAEIELTNGLPGYPFPTNPPKEETYGLLNPTPGIWELGANAWGGDVLL